MLFNDLRTFHIYIGIRNVVWVQNAFVIVADIKFVHIETSPYSGTRIHFSLMNVLIAAGL